MKAGLILAVLALGACGGSSTPSKSGDGTITITMPANNATVTADAANPDVDLFFTVAKFTLEDPSLKLCGGKSSCGHVHMVVDGTACDDPSAPAAYNNQGFASPTSVGLDYCPSISGSHVVVAQLHNDDHSTYTDAAGDPVTSTITITVP